MRYGELKKVTVLGSKANFATLYNKCTIVDTAKVVQAACTHRV
jgi:hypothetical protein